MTEVSFYHLQRDPLDKALPRLLEKVVERKFRVLVRGKTDNLISALDESLWTYRPVSFLPHGRVGETDQPESQPILLTTEESQNPNDATVLTLLEDAPADDLSGFERCLYMFDGNNDDALGLARARWKLFKDLDVPVSYNQQTETGWQKRA